MINIRTCVRCWEREIHPRVLFFRIYFSSHNQFWNMSFSTNIVKWYWDGMKNQHNFEILVDSLSGFSKRCLTGREDNKKIVLRAQSGCRFPTRVRMRSTLESITCAILHLVFVFITSLLIGHLVQWTCWKWWRRLGRIERAKDLRWFFAQYSLISLL